MYKTIILTTNSCPEQDNLEKARQRLLQVLKGRQIVDVAPVSKIKLVNLLYIYVYFI